MAVWSFWFNDILPHVSGCPSVLVEHELRRAAQVFFEGTRAWKVTGSVQAVTADTETVVVYPDDAEQELVRVEQAWYDGKAMDIYTSDEMDVLYWDDWKSHTGTPFAIIQDTPGQVRLYPVPDVDSTTGIQFRISVRPSDSATGIPDEFRIKYREAFANGAKSRLMLYPQKPWSVPELGIVLGQAFDAVISKANADAAMSFGKGGIRSRPNWC